MNDKKKQELETTGSKCDPRTPVGVNPIPVKQRKDRKDNVVHGPSFFSPALGQFGCEERERGEW